MNQAPLAATEEQDAEGLEELDLAASDAAFLRGQAEAHRAAAAATGDPLWRATTLAHAEALERVAEETLTPGSPLRRGPGGEVVLREDLDAPWPKREIAQATRAGPDLLDAEATVERLTLARDAGSLALAVDAAERLGAASPAEQVLAHQMVTAHTLAMRLAARSDAFLARRFIPYGPGHGAAEAEARREQVASIEAARLAGASARMMEATARAAVALDRLRNGTQQRIVVIREVEAKAEPSAEPAPARAVPPPPVSRGE